MMQMNTSRGRDITHFHQNYDIFSHLPTQSQRYVQQQQRRSTDSPVTSAAQRLSQLILNTQRQRDILHPGSSASSSLPAHIASFRDAIAIHPHLSRSTAPGAVYNTNARHMFHERGTQRYQFRHIGTWTRSRLTGADEEPATIDWQRLRIAFDEYDRAVYELRKLEMVKKRSHGNVRRGGDIDMYRRLVSGVVEAVRYERRQMKERLLEVLPEEVKKQDEGDFAERGRYVDVINLFIDKKEEIIQLCKGLDFFIEEAFPQMQLDSRNTFNELEMYLAMPMWHRLQIVIRCAASLKDREIATMFDRVEGSTIIGVARRAQAIADRAREAAPRRVMPRRGDGGRTTNATEDVEEENHERMVAPRRGGRNTGALAPLRVLPRRGRGSGRGGGGDGRTTNASEDVE